MTPPEVLDRPAAAMQRGAGRLFQSIPQGPSVEEVLRGRRWLGHPLHPLLTDLVVGAWTVAWFFDLLDPISGKRLRPGADTAVWLGLGGVLPTALAGIADWRETSGVPRRLGLVHAVLQSMTSLVYVLSAVQRLRGRRRPAVLWGHLGFALLNVSAYLGGELVYDAGVQVRTGGSVSEFPRRGSEPRLRHV